MKCFINLATLITSLLLASCASHHQSASVDHADDRRVCVTCIKRQNIWIDSSYYAQLTTTGIYIADSNEYLNPKLLMYRVGRIKAKGEPVTRYYEYLFSNYECLTNADIQVTSYSKKAFVPVKLRIGSIEENLNNIEFTLLQRLFRKRRLDIYTILGVDKSVKLGCAFDVSPNFGGLIFHDDTENTMSWNIVFDKDTTYLYSVDYARGNFITVDYLVKSRNLVAKIPIK